MRYTVLWTQFAEWELTEIWLSASDRNFVARAAAEIDALLETSPMECGESREGNLRLMFVSRLAVEFEVYPDDRKVLVRSIWLVAPGKSR